MNNFFKRGIIILALLMGLSACQESNLKYSPYEMNEKINAVLKELSVTKIKYLKLYNINRRMEKLKLQNDQCLTNTTKEINKIDLFSSKKSVELIMQPGSAVETEVINKKNKLMTKLAYCEYFDYKFNEIFDLLDEQIEAKTQLSFLYAHKSTLWQNLLGLSQMEPMGWKDYLDERIVSLISDENILRIPFIILFFGVSMAFVFYGFSKIRWQHLSNFDLDRRDFIFKSAAYASIFLLLLGMDFYLHEIFEGFRSLIYYCGFIFLLWTLNFILDKKWFIKKLDEIYKAFQILVFFTSVLYLFLIFSSFIYTNTIPPAELFNIKAWVFRLVILRLALFAMQDHLIWNDRILRRSIFLLLIYLSFIEFLYANIDLLVRNDLELENMIEGAMKSLSLMLNFGYFMILFRLIQIPQYRKYLLVKSSLHLKMGLYALIFLICAILVNGYELLAMLFIPLLISIGVCGLIVYEQSHFIEGIYQSLMMPGHPASKKLRTVLGVKEKDSRRLSEIFPLRLVSNFPIVFIGLMAIAECLGITYVRMGVIFNVLFKGIHCFGTVIYPFNWLRGFLFYSIVIIAGKILASRVAAYRFFQVDKHAQITIELMITYFTYGLGLFLALYLAGVNFSGLLILAGAFSVGIGFGLQHFTSDFISGIFLMIGKPIKIGDHVTIDEKEGFVKRIGIFSTQIRTLMHSDVIIPNSRLITKSLTNFTFNNNRVTLISIKILMGKKVDLRAAERALYDVAINHEKVLKDEGHMPMVLYHLNFLELRCMIDDVAQKGIVTSELNFEIAKVFNELNIEFTLYDMLVRPIGTLPL